MNNLPETNEEQPKKKMGRPAGIGKYKPKQPVFAKILKIKKAVVDLIEAEEADNLTEAAVKLGISKIQLYDWAASDKQWAALVRQSQEIKADRLEAELDNMTNPVARIFRLKKLRPEYRDNFHIDVHSESLEKLLTELKQLGQAPIKEKPPEE